MKKLLVKTSLGIIGVSPIIGVFSCSKKNSFKNEKHFAYLVNNKWDEQIDIQVKTPWGEVDFAKFAKNIQDEFNKLKNEYPLWKNKKDVIINVDSKTGDDNILVQNVSSGKKDFAISSITSINLGNRHLISPKLQTLTNSFKFDKTWSSYKDGSSNDELIKIAKKQTDLFKEPPYSILSNDESSWTGSIYKKFYDVNTKVDFYRGMIWIAGSPINIKNIEKAWNDKNWNNFKNFGILHGKKTSGGKFKLQERLLKKHFGENAFTTLSEEIQNSPKLFKEIAAKTMKKHLPNYKIAFDDEGSFAWTKNRTKSKGSNSDSENNNYSAPNMQILVVTEPLKYDIGYFRKNFDIKQSNLLIKVFINLTKAPKKDVYGPSIGYNGYKRVQDIYEEMEKKHKDVMST